ncbi:Fc.00g084740.m01.CDS01 [Cosmosporella sp. VM-42]
MGDLASFLQGEIHLDDFTLPPYSRAIGTRSPKTRAWWEYGLTWSYAFNHAESALCFEKAIENDPSCAIAYWGLAFALGPNYNKPWSHFDQDDIRNTVARAYRAVQDGIRLSSTATPAEWALIHALQHRFPSDKHERVNPRALNVAYAEAMTAVYNKFRDDLDVAALYADALMNLTPWALWDLKTGKPAPGSRVLEAKAVLERALAQKGGYEHVGLLHLYVHLIEMSTEPERALPAAENLRRLAADTGHLAHMPSHLDVLIGDYRRAIAANTAAVQADNKFVRLRGGGDFYTIYRMHNFHSLIYAALFAGQFKVAMDATAQMEAAMPEVVLRVRSPPMADWMETFWSVRPHVLIRFGRWRDILELKVPEDQELYCVTTATIHYAKGVAWAATGNVEEGARERELFLKAKERVPPSRMDYPNKCIDILNVGEAMLDGELEYRRGNIELAFTNLRKSIALDDNLVYSEPWAWMQPARHAYAALLMEQGRIEEAAEAYRTDLGLNDAVVRGRHHPNNVWALHGYHECCVKLGLHGEERMVRQQLKTAMAFVDVEIRATKHQAAAAAAESSRAEAPQKALRDLINSSDKDFLFSLRKEYDEFGRSNNESESSYTSSSVQWDAHDLYATPGTAGSKVGRHGGGQSVTTCRTRMAA